MADLSHLASRDPGLNALLRGTDRPSVRTAQNSLRSTDRSSVRTAQGSHDASPHAVLRSTNRIPVSDAGILRSAQLQVSRPGPDARHSTLDRGASIGERRDLISQQRIESHREARRLENWRGARRRTGDNLCCYSRGSGRPGASCSKLTRPAVDNVHEVSFDRFEATEPYVRYVSKASSNAVYQ